MKRMKILLVDDDEDDREFFADALLCVDPSSNLELADNGKICLFHLDNKKEDLPNLIFLDINMPVMNGLECLMEIRKNDLYKNLPVAMYSTSSSQKDIEESYKKGANIYITKPFNFEELKKTISSVLKMDWLCPKTQGNMERYLLKI